MATTAIDIFHSDARDDGLFSSIMVIGTVAGALRGAGRDRPVLVFCRPASASSGSTAHVRHTWPLGRHRCRRLTPDREPQSQAPQPPPGLPYPVARFYVQASHLENPEIMTATLQKAQQSNFRILHLFGQNAVIAITSSSRVLSCRFLGKSVL